MENVLAIDNQSRLAHDHDKHSNGEHDESKKKDIKSCSLKQSHDVRRGMPLKCGNGAVSSSQHLASKAGLEMLKRGGNAAG